MADRIRGPRLRWKGSPKRGTRRRLLCRTRARPGLDRKGSTSVGVAESFGHVAVAEARVGVFVVVGVVVVAVVHGFQRFLSN